MCFRWFIGRRNWSTCHPAHHLSLFSILKSHHWGLDKVLGSVWIFLCPCPSWSHRCCWRRSACTWPLLPSKRPDSLLLTRQFQHLMGLKFLLLMFSKLCQWTHKQQTVWSENCSGELLLVCCWRGLCTYGPSSCVRLNRGAVRWPTGNGDCEASSGGSVTSTWKAACMTHIRIITAKVDLIFRRCIFQYFIQTELWDNRKKTV